MEVCPPKVKIGKIPHPNIEIYLDGVGTASEENGSAIYVEFYEGKWKLVVWSDISKEDPTHIIDMSDAMEIAR